MQRYSRQIILPKFGIEAQNKLLKAKVLVVGAGGLGCPVLQYLSAAGVGSIGIVDFDRVEESNLQRQTLFNEEDIGKLKAETAKEKLQKVNSEINFKAYSKVLTNKNVWSILKDYDLAVDCTDNFEVRYIVNDACVLLNKPMVYGAVYQYEGQVSVFNLSGVSSPNYRDLYPIPPNPGAVPSCNTSGVLGTLSGLVGTIQANEVIKIITGISKPLSNKLMVINILDYSPMFLRYKKLIATQQPQTKEEFEGMDYAEFCGIKYRSEKEIKTLGELEYIFKQQKAVLIDIRSENEKTEELAGFPTVSIPVSELEEELDKLNQYNTWVFVCRSGLRSLYAAQMAEQKYSDKNILHIHNGIKTLTSNETIS